MRKRRFDAFARFSETCNANSQGVTHLLPNTIENTSVSAICFFGSFQKTFLQVHKRCDSYPINIVHWPN